MKLDEIHHIAIICSDKDAALDFYVNKLGFSIIRTNVRPEREDIKIDLRVNETTELELFIMKDRPARVSGSIRASASGLQGGIRAGDGGRTEKNGHSV